MLEVVESFSGIGSQVKALKNRKIEHKIVATIDWDINAIIAYDIINNGKPELNEYSLLEKDELIDILKEYVLSSNGKEAMPLENLRKMKKIELEHLVGAIKRTNNLTSITSVKGEDLPLNIDLFTYSFPCQDLSIAGTWHGNNSGIDRKLKNRSGMLWEVERILIERRKKNLPLPKFLLMENVSNILSNKHKNNFQEWKDNLEKLDYVNYVYSLNAKDFGIPQKRIRTYMLSVKCDDEKIKNQVEDYIENNDLRKEEFREKLEIETKTLKDILKIDYEANNLYKEEANRIQPNETPSRIKIYEENDKIFDGKKILIDTIATITTKQDRNPNSGVIDYDSGRLGKSKFRYLTPRECFMLMGFDEEDFQILIDNNFTVGKNRKFFTDSKLYKLAGNSIVVNVLEQIFMQVDYINRNILKNK